MILTAAAAAGGWAPGGPAPMLDATFMGFAALSGATSYSGTVEPAGFTGYAGQMAFCLSDHIGPDAIGMDLAGSAATQIGPTAAESGIKLQAWKQPFTGNTLDWAVTTGGTSRVTLFFWRTLGYEEIASGAFAYDISAGTNSTDGTLTLASPALSLIAARNWINAVATPTPVADLTSAALWAGRTGAFTGTVTLTIPETRANKVGMAIQMQEAA